MKQSFHILECACLVTVVSITGLALLTNRFGWSIYLELFSHFQVQYFIVALLFAAIALCLGHFRILLGIFFCSAILSAQILP
ncbi:MAG: endonuclease/exonuclease/phosphatase family protein, partial [Cyanobacteria bacterium J06607_17]